MPATVSASALAQYLDCSETYVSEQETEGVIQWQGDGFPLDRAALALSRVAATPFAPATARIEFVDHVLPSDDLIFKPNPTVRANVGRLRKPACLLHAVAWCGSRE